MSHLVKQRTGYFFLNLLLAFFAVSCSKNIPVHKYYILDYFPGSESTLLTRKDPLPYNVEVRNFRVNRIYDNSRIVVRYSSHQINYYRYTLWAVRPQIAIPDLIVTHINQYNIFENCQREFLDIKPDYEISGEVLKIEKFQSKGYEAAHLSLIILFTRSSDGELLKKQVIDREAELFSDDITFFVKKLSDIIREEVDVFLISIIELLEPQEAK
jgi:ABC-type uncharacterized transport system auxiliary subunit